MVSLALHQALLVSGELRWGAKASLALDLTGWSLSQALLAELRLGPMVSLVSGELRSGPKVSLDWMAW